MGIKNFFDGGKQISDSAGLPLNGGKCNFYEPTTTTPKNTYTTSALSVANANPVVLDSAGRANVWLNGNYRVIVQDSSNNTIYDEDNINPSDTTSLIAVSGPTTLDANYDNRVVEASGATTLTLSSAAILGAGWSVTIRNVDSTNNVTIARANAGNTFNGSASNITMFPGDAFRIIVNDAEDGFFTTGGRVSNESNASIYGSPGFVRNYSITASVAGNALTVALKGVNGSDPSTANPVTFAFRNVTATSGDYTNIAVTTATSVVASSGSTAGTTSAVASGLWIVGFNDAGTFRLGFINCSTATNIYPLADDILASATAEGGAGAADSAGVIYAGAAVTSKAMRVLGYVESTQATAGTWATAPSKIQLWTPGMKLPGDVVQIVISSTGASASGSTTIPYDDTIPQNGEGNQYLTLSITPSRAPNILRVDTALQWSASAGTTNNAMALFRDAVTSAVACSWGRGGATEAQPPMSVSYMAIANTVASTTFNVRAGGDGGTFSLNGASATRIYGGAMASYIIITELMG